MSYVNGWSKSSKFHILNTFLILYLLHHQKHPINFGYYMSLTKAIKMTQHATTSSASKVKLRLQCI